MTIAHQTRLAFIVSSFLGLHILFAHWRPLCVWGMDLLAFQSPWLQGLFPLAALLLFSPRMRQIALDLGSRIANAIEALPFARKSWFLPLLLGSGAAVFPLYPSAVHLLGDGYLYLRELPLAAAHNFQRIGHEPLTFWLLNLLYRTVPASTDAAEITCRTYSYISGVLYLLLVPLAARIWGRNRVERVLLVGFLLTPGYIQLFFGYVETYAPLLPTILLYLMGGVQVLRGQLPLWTVALLLGLIIPLHFTTVMFAPSLIALAILARGQRKIWRQFILLMPTPALSLLVLLGLGMDPLAYAANLRGSHFLPLWGPLTSIELYHLLAPDHFVDYLNLLILVAPGAVLVCALLHKALFSRRPENLFLLSAAIFPLLFIFLANPEIGFFRDWDVLTFSVLPLTLWTALALIDRLPTQESLAHAGLAICTAAGLHTASWIALNANGAAAQTRFVHALEQCPLSAHARSYGWETLGIYRRERNDPEGALKAYRKAATAVPDHPRYWVSIGHLAREQGRATESLDAYQKALQINPHQADIWVHLGVLQAQLQRYDISIKAYRKALELQSNDPVTWHNMGDAYSHLGRHDEAIAAFDNALRLRPDLVATHFNLGVASEKAGIWERAEAAYRKVVDLDPHHLHARNQLGGLYLDRGQLGKALATFRRALDIDSTYALAHFNLALAHKKLGQDRKFRYHGQQFLHYGGGDRALAEQMRRLLK